MSNSTNLATSQQQQQQAVNYLNKEPFNEDIEIEESSLVHDLKWRAQVVDKFKAKIEEIKQLQTSTDSNVTNFLSNVDVEKFLILVLSLFLKEANPFA